MVGNFKKRVNVYYDAEFTGLHKDTTLISIGLVSETNAHFYAEFNDYDKSQITDWIEDNVIQNLQFNELNDYYSMEKFNNLAEEDENGVSPIYLNIHMKGNRDQVKEQLILWLGRISDVVTGRKIQIYTDCYAYDWVLLIDLLCGNALNIPDYIDYIPIDLSTAFRMKNIDPDINREEFIHKIMVDSIKDHDPFTKFGDNLKHNSLWDAYVCRECFDKLSAYIPSKNRRKITAEAIEKAYANVPGDVKDFLMHSWFGERIPPSDEQ